MVPKILSRYENLAKELIHHILGLEDEKDENFTASMDFVLSNILYHHYLDVNSHTVQRSLEGVAFKMAVHGHQKKADQLQTLIKKFLFLPDVEGKGDVKWSILSVLNELSQHPARDSLPPSFATDNEGGSLESSSRTEIVTDWLGDLMEKSFHFPDKDDTLSEWSDDDDTLRQSLSCGIEAESQQQEQKEQKPVGEFHLRAPTTPIKEREKRNALLKAAQDARFWFADHVQKPYWKENKIDPHCSNPGNRSSIVLTEYVVMRECIWLLVHPSNGFLFKRKDDMFIVSEPVALSTLGQGDLKSILERFTSAASKLYVLDKWLKDIEVLILKDVSSSHGSLGGTLLAYADGLREWRLGTFNLTLAELEKTVFAQEGCQTLLYLLDKLRPSFSTLEVIYDVHTKALSSNDSRVIKSLRLLSLLIQGVESGLKSEDKKCLLILFQYSIKSYLKAIHSLLWGTGPPSASALEDFGIVKNNIEDDGTVKKFLLQDVSEFDLPGLSFLSILRKILIEVCELKVIVQDLNFEEDRSSDFLEKILEDQINSTYFEECESDQIRTSEANTTTATTTCNNNNNNMESCTENDYEGNCILEMCEANVFLMMAFSLDDSEETLTCQTSAKSFDRENFKECKGLDHLLRSTLLPVIQNRHAYMGRFLLESLSESHGLRQQMKVLVSAILLDSSYTSMQDFCSYLFNKINSKERLDEGDLTQNLQLCLGISYPEIAPYFNVVFPQNLKSKKQSNSSPTEEVLSSLCLDFSDLWPLCIVLKKSHVIKCNKIFQFCLMLRRASFTLERLHFKEIGSFSSFGPDDDSVSSSCSSLGEKTHGDDEDQASSPNAVPLAFRIHRLQLLRQWVLYFARVLRDHFSSAVFVPFSAKIDELLTKSNFSDFKREHEALLAKTFHDCLLDEETLSPIQVTLMQLFSTVERIHDLWVGPPQGIKHSELSELEENYSSCHRLVANFLSTLASVKYCPLVDGLAQCLTYNSPM